ncbi:hypothetical protein [Pollutibacter soli]|uniref:hypothetical protein n=1 Tax=Pollutibacter soli TaxID=3034157 RepID=UPI0030137A81
MSAGKIKMAVIGLSVMVLSSCDSGEKTSLVNPQAPAALAAPQAPVTLPAPTSATPAAGAVASSGPLNPAHGQPGHRCDIPVGSPLSQATAAPTAQAIANPQPISLPAVSSNSNGPLNPKHGEPGHRCDIPVGSPLNGAAPVAAAAQPQVTQQQPAVTPVPSQLQLPQLNAGSGKTNPQHGQPGHRCDLPVGAALP